MSTRRMHGTHFTLGVQYHVYRGLGFCDSRMSYFTGTAIYYVPNRQEITFLSTSHCGRYILKFTSHFHCYQPDISLSTVFM